MPTEDASVKSESANGRRNEVETPLLRATFVVTAPDGLALSGPDLDEHLDKGDEVVLNEDVAKLLLRQGVIKPA